MPPFEKDSVIVSERSAKVAEMLKSGPSNAKVLY